MFRTTGAIADIRRTLYGFEAEITLDRVHAASTLLQSRETIAGIFRVAQIDAQAHPTDVSQATLRLVQRDLLEEWAGRPWPGLEADVSLWEPIDLSWDRFGNDIRLELTDRPHILLAGQTRSGKSVAQSMFVATGALSGAQLFLFDRNRFMTPWRLVAKRYVVGDMTYASDVLDELLAETDRRFELTDGAKLDRPLAERLGLPILLVVVDEGAVYLDAKDFMKKITELAARGQACGLRIVFGTQSPNATVIPTPFRNNMQRIAFRVADSNASRVALDTSAVDASEISKDQPGVCYLDLDGMVPTRTRTYFVTPTQVQALAARAAEMRR